MCKNWRDAAGRVAELKVGVHVVGCNYPWWFGHCSKSVGLSLRQVQQRSKIIKIQCLILKHPKTLDFDDFDHTHWILDILNVPFGTALLMSNFFWHRNCASQPAASNPQRREARDPSERTHRSRGHRGPPRNFGKRGWDASRIKSSAPMGWVVYCAIGSLSPKLKGGRGVGGDHKPYKHETDVGSRQEFAFARKLDATWVGKNQII